MRKNSLLDVRMSRTQQKYVLSSEMESGATRKAVRPAKFELLISILEKLVVEGAMGSTYLAHRLNLKPSVLNEHIAPLIEGGLVKSEWFQKRRVFSTTDAGFTAGAQYLSLKRSVMWAQMPDLQQVAGINAAPASMPFDPREWDE